jgi:DNA polymerase III sliding clamp (beta) subunit (PCNA family)
MNYFKDNKLYQWDKNKDIFTITKTDIQEEFCLDQKGMEMFLKFSNPEITLGQTLKVKNGKLKANIKLCNEPLVLPNMTFTSTFTLDVDKLKVANKFVSTSQQKPILTGVNVSKGYIAATDSFFAYRNECKADCNITIASRYIDVLTAVSGEVEIKCNNNTIACEIGDTTYIGKLLDGTYPNVAGLFREQRNQAIISKQELKELLSFSNAKNDYVVLENNKLTIEGENDFEADINLNINCSICVALDRIATVINCVQSEEIIFKYEDGVHPIYINDNYLVLPVRRS